MKKQLTVITIQLLFICYSCQNRKQDFSGVTEIQVDRDQARDYQLPEVIEIKKYVQLETRDSCLIGEVVGIKCVDSCFYINSRYSDLYRFNSDGRFLNSIGHQGEGPEEFQFLLDFDINHDSSQVEIFSPGEKRIKTYSVNGKYHSSQTTEVRNGRISRLNNGQHFVYIRNSNYLGDSIKNQYVLFLVEDLRYPDKMIPVIPLYNRYLDLSGGKDNFWQDHEKTLFHYGYNDTVYQLIGGKVDHKYHVDFGNKISIKGLGMIKERIEAINVISDALYSSLGKRVFISDNFTFFDYYYKHRNQKFVMNRVSKEELHYSNLLIGSDTISLDPALLRDDNYIALVEPFQIIAHPDEFIKCGLKREFISNLKEHQNPIIIYYSYKINHNN